MALRRHIALWHAWPIGPNKSAKFRLSGSPTPKIIATSGSYYGIGGQYWPVRRNLTLFGDTFTGSDGTETPHCTFGMRGPSGRTSLPSFVALGSPTPRDNRDFTGSYYG
ncbi:hypothetical protein DPMN_092453 [Dreissena polymorpha]|uniref:Uncharacterized protein n=1 Tax=Dreissena polymorpha TaxID=45954 RepID=A0A9D4R0W9_DREPO|nr:hypothetical protein DPMN_092453 [Dreissena polymorpha]